MILLNHLNNLSTQKKRRCGNQIAVNLIDKKWANHIEFNNIIEKMI